MGDHTCIIDGCEKRAKTIVHGYCSAHHAKWQKYGDPLAGKTYGQGPRTCTVPECESEVKGAGLCNAHLIRARRGGPPNSTPVQQRHSSPADALAARTAPQGDCAVWTGSLFPAGYGQIRVDGKPMRAHRFAWENANGPIPDGMLVDHICHNRACVRVEHLRLATHAENESNRSGATASSATGVRNVSPHRDGYVVAVGRRGESRYRGTFATVEEAAEAAARERQAAFGKFSGRG